MTLFQTTHNYYFGPGRVQNLEAVLVHWELTALERGLVAPSRNRFQSLVSIFGPSVFERK